MKETRLRDITLCREGFRTLKKFFRMSGHRFLNAKLAPA